MLEHNAKDYRHIEQFWCEVTRLHDEGYKFKSHQGLCSMTVFPVLRVILTKSTPEVLLGQEDKIAAAREDAQKRMENIELQEELEGLMKKMELLEFADKIDVVISDDKKNPSAIKKYLKVTLEDM